MEEKDINLISGDPETPPDFLAQDKFFIENDPFVIQQNKIKRAILDHSKDMKPWHITAAKMIFRGESENAVIKKVRRAYKTLREVRKTGEFKRLIYLLECLDAHKEGADEETRKNMLWRIAARNEEFDPKESIKAVSELNKMSKPKDGATGLGGGSINIIINNEILKKGPLDG